MDDVTWKRAVVHAPDARYTQAHVTYDAASRGVHIRDRKTGDVIGVYQLDAEPSVQLRGHRNKPELGGAVDGHTLSIVADCDCPKATRRIDKRRADV